MHRQEEDQVRLWGMESNRNLYLNIVGNRDGRAIGPVAFFGRGDHSLLMTRSIGDRVGPESAIPLPDITTVTVHATQHARCPTIT